MTIARVSRLTGILLLCGVIGLFPAPSSGTPPTGAESAAPCVVAVLTYDESGRVLARGSGFFVTPTGDVITSRHFFQGAARAEVITSGKETLAVAAVVGDDPERGLLRLSTESGKQNLPCRSPVTTMAEVGERVVVLGSPSAQRFATAEGTVSAVRDLPLLGRVIRIAAPVTSGFIGGPVVNGRGEVIGVTASGSRGKERAVYAVPAEWISRLDEGGPTSRLSVLSPARESYVKGIKHLWEGDHEMALSSLERSVELDPRHGDAHFLLGYSYSSAGRFYDAIGSYRQALRLDPENSEARYLLGLAYSMLHCYQDAAESFEKVISLNPDDFRAYYKLGYAYSRLGWQEEAKDTFKRAIAYRCRNVLSGEAACSDNALLDLTEVIDAFRQHNWSEASGSDVHYQRGLTYIVMAQMDLALREYQTLRKLDESRAARLFQIIRP